MSLVCTLFFLHILISIIRKLNTFCINVRIREMLLQKQKGQGINTVIAIPLPLCNFLMSITLFFTCVFCLIFFFRNLVLLEFGDLDLIFKVTLALWNLIFYRKKFYAFCGGGGWVSNKRCLLTIFILSVWVVRHLFLSFEVFLLLLLVNCFSRLQILFWQCFRFGSFAKTLPPSFLV